MGIVSQNLLIDYLKPVTGTRPHNGGKTSAVERRNQRDSKSTISGTQISTKTTVAVATKQQKILSTSETRVLVWNKNWAFEGGTKRRIQKAVPRSSNKHKKYHKTTRLVAKSSFRYSQPKRTSNGIGNWIKQQMCNLLGQIFVCGHKTMWACYCMFWLCPKTAKWMPYLS